MKQRGKWCTGGDTRGLNTMVVRGLMGVVDQFCLQRKVEVSTSLSFSLDCRRVSHILQLPISRWHFYRTSLFLAALFMRKKCPFFCSVEELNERVRGWRRRMFANELNNLSCKIVTNISFWITCHFPPGAAGPQILGVEKAVFIRCKDKQF